jgi:CheY-like chemotaxis protein
VFELDLASAEEADIEPVLESVGDLDEIDGEGRTILVVEDVPDMRALLCDLLNGCGFVGIPVADGAGVVETMKRELPDLVLMGQADGRLLEAIRSHHPHVPVLLYASVPPPTAAWRVFDDVLLKPSNAGELLASIARLLNIAKEASRDLATARASL